MKNSINCNPDGSVELYHNNSKKLETTTTGANVTGDFIFGANSKAKLFENGTQSGVQATNSGSSSHLMTHDGNEDTYVDPSGYIKFEVAGSEKVRIDSSGNLQVSSGQFTVGTTASTGLQLINDGTFGTIHSLDLKIRTAATERLRIRSAGGHRIQCDESWHRSNPIRM